jgi:putative restriction endonuclease
VGRVTQMSICTMTKVEAIKKVLDDNGGIATWEIIYNEIEKYYPEAKASREWAAGIRGVLYREIKNDRSFKKIDEGTFALRDYDENKLLLSPKDLITTKDVIAAIRIGQNEFRKKLITTLRRCPITGVTDPRILTASHIKPWTQSNNVERLDVKNGFLFSPTFDRMFDRGIISFTNDKHLLVSETFSQDNLNRLKLEQNQIISDLPIAGREEYLEYHRNKIFIHA